MNDDIVTRLRPINPCIRCGGEKERGVRGTRICISCKSKPPEKRIKPIKPCTYCGGDKERGQGGRRICLTCKETPPFDRNAKKLEWREQNRRKKGIKPKLLRVRSDGFVWCKDCNDFLHPSKFNLRDNSRIKFTPEYAHSYAPYCKTHEKINRRKQLLSTEYNMSLEDYERLLKLQNNVCFICHDVNLTQHLCVDHNHITGEVRGLLCNNCNRRILGALNDDIDALKRAIEYLENPPFRSLIKETNND